MIQGNSRHDFANSISGASFPSVVLKVILTSPQSIPSTGGAFTAISWTSAEKDTHGVWNPATPTLIKAPIDGKYVGMSFIEYAANATGSRRTQLLMAQATEEWPDAAPIALGSQYIFNWCASELTAGANVVLNTLQDSGGPLNVVSAWCAIWIPKGYNFIG